MELARGSAFAPRESDTHAMAKEWSNKKKSGRGFLSIEPSNLWGNWGRSGSWSGLFARLSDVGDECVGLCQSIGPSWGPEQLVCHGSPAAKIEARAPRRNP